MALMVWNVRGLNLDVKIREVKTLVVPKKIDVVGMNGTKIKKGRQEEVMRKWGVDWAFHSNIGVVGDSKGDTIWIGWNANIWEGNVELVSRQAIHAELCNWGGLHIKVTVIYGKNNRLECMELGMLFNRSKTDGS